MRSITISGSLGSVTLLKDLVFTVQKQDIVKKQTMASGKIVLDVVGTRTLLNVPVGYLTPDNLRLLLNLIGTDHILKVSYPDVDGDKTGLFLIDQPRYKAVIYGENSVVQWIGVTLVMTAQEAE